MEIGCGTGANLDMLASFGHVCGMERDDYARECAWAASNGRVEIVEGSLPDDLGRASGPYDLVCMFDVLEHVEDDRRSLANIRALVATGGSLLITVPAYQWLWSVHDETLGHHRRYTRRGLVGLLRDTGYTVRYAGYLNFYTLPLLAAARTADRLLHREQSSGSGLPPRPINAALYALMRLESLLLPRVSYPCGSTVAVLAER